MSLLLVKALEVIDRENTVDPSHILFEGTDYATALIEGVQAHHWVQHFRPRATEPLIIAARGHHLRRWEIPRNSYQRSRRGYLAWRDRLYAFQAEVVAEVMHRVGYTEDAVAQADFLLRKQGIGADANAQTYEDAVSLAFLEVRLTSFMDTVSEEQLSRALHNTWRKMSESGHAAALTLNLEPKAAEVISRALT